MDGNKGDLAGQQKGPRRIQRDNEMEQGSHESVKETSITCVSCPYLASIFRHAGSRDARQCVPVKTLMPTKLL